MQVCGIGFDERTGRGRNAPLPLLLRISLHNKIEKPLVSISREKKVNFGKACVGYLLVFCFYALICLKTSCQPFDLNSPCSVATFQSFALLLRMSARLRQAGGGSSFWTQLDSNLRAESLEQGCAERVQRVAPSLQCTLPSPIYDQASVLF